ncbi:transcriptional regulator [Vibrio sp. 10N.286.49.B3]|uniref:DUF1488 domain-containing protein n=1 Tax=Vibrio sp. 10N.286.49.B3 TaxID=1880855 RepID=UPI000C81BA66|nr:DUF1488 domain-containing protein [Vibrio sp. 10N.286.49.B3]PMH45374.1 transcriptional regulator [Vibrio sp. 10N.286.49.B3]
MNQSILFPDAQEWDAETQQVIFPAQQAGALIQCAVSIQYLARVVGLEVETRQQALSAFEVLRFDLEELAEELIEDEAFAPDGKIIID